MTNKMNMLYFANAAPTISKQNLNMKGVVADAMLTSGLPRKSSSGLRQTDSPHSLPTPAPLSRRPGARPSHTSRRCLRVFVSIGQSRKTPRARYERPVLGFLCLCERRFISFARCGLVHNANVLVRFSIDVMKVVGIGDNFSTSTSRHRSPGLKSGASQKVAERTSGRA